MQSMSTGEIKMNPVVIIVLGFLAGMGAMAIIGFYKFAIKYFKDGEF